MPVNEQVIDGINTVNTKVFAEAATKLYLDAQQLDLQTRQDYAASRNRIAILAEKALAKSLESMDAIGFEEALSLVKAGSGDDLAQKQVAAKVAQSTSPETGFTPAQMAWLSELFKSTVSK